MIKKYYTYIKENKNFSYVNIRDIINKTTFLEDVEKELNNLLLNKVCLWYTKGDNTLKKQIVTDIKVRRHIGGQLYIYFNDFGVDTTETIVRIELSSSLSSDISLSITDEEKEKVEIIGHPSGEVLYIDKSLFIKLSSFGHIKYNKSKNFYYFEDNEYYTIMKVINPNYEKPKKKNIKEKLKYNVDDVVICKGKSGMLDLTDKIGRITQVRESQLKESGTNYLVSFILNFSEYLMVGNNWWIKKENIKGIYTGDLELQKILGDLRYKDKNLEDHEIDDDYHLRQLFRKNGVVEVGGEPLIKYKNPKDRPDVGEWVIIDNIHGIHRIEDRNLKDDKFAILYGNTISLPKKTWFEFDNIIAHSKNPNDLENIRKNLNNNISALLIKIGDSVILSNKNEARYDKVNKIFINSNAQLGQKLGDVRDIKFFAPEYEDGKWVWSISESSLGIKCAHVTRYWYKISCLDK
jgi:hypothetical protein